MTSGHEPRIIINLICTEVPRKRERSKLLVRMVPEGALLLRSALRIKAKEEVAG